MIAQRLKAADLAEFARQLVAGVRRNRPELDQRIEETAANWSLRRWRPRTATCCDWALRDSPFRHAAAGGDRRGGRVGQAFRRRVGPIRQRCARQAHAFWVRVPSPSGRELGRGHGRREAESGIALRGLDDPVHLNLQYIPCKVQHSVNCSR